jgi:hypothetical protein
MHSVSKGTKFPVEIALFLSKVKSYNEAVEKPTPTRLMENVQMQGFRNRGPARRVGSPSEARTNPEE